MIGNIQIVSIILLFAIFGCNNESTQKNDIEKKNKSLIPPKEYIKLSDNCNSKIISKTLIEQISIKLYLFKNNLISEDELVQNTVLYFNIKPDKNLKQKFLENFIEIDWSSWVPPSDNHPLGFVVAKVPIKNFEKGVCIDEVKKMDTGERNLEPELLEKVSKLHE